MNSNVVTSKSIIIKVSGGLGNQLFQYALGRNLQLTHHQPVSFDLSWYSTQTLRTYELQHFHATVPLANYTRIGPLFRYRPRGGMLGRFLDPFRVDTKRYKRETHPGFDPEVLTLEAPAYLDGYWQSEKYFAPIRNLLQQELTLKELPNDANAQLLERIASSPSISLHVRRGDYVTSASTNAFHGTASLDYYRAGVEHLATVTPGATIYIFSDDQAWVKDNLHFSQPTVFVDVNSADRARDDIRLMSACQHHIIANSSFSWWGAWLNPKPGKVVVAPKRWFADPTVDTADLVPQEWVRL